MFEPDTGDFESSLDILRNEPDKVVIRVACPNLPPELEDFEQGTVALILACSHIMVELIKRKARVRELVEHVLGTTEPDESWRN